MEIKKDLYTKKFVSPIADIEAYKEAYSVQKKQALIEKDNMVMGASVRMVFPMTAELAATFCINADAGTRVVIYDNGFTAVMQEEKIIRKLTLKERHTTPLFPITVKVNGVEIKKYSDAVRYLKLNK